MKTLCLLLPAAVCVASGIHPVLAADESKPRLNVVIIYADDLGNGDLACYGHPKFKTPHLDRMAREGARLTQFYSSCPYCAPSRSSLMTGRYPFRNGMFSNPHPAGDYAIKGRASGDEAGLPSEEITLGEAFQKAGYQTACYGKWHLGHKPQFYPTRNGFGDYFGILYSNDMHPVELFEREKMVEFPVVQTTLTRRYTERAVSFIRENRERPFFLYLPHAMPHKPLAASDEYYKQTGTGLYGDVIAELDAGVGRVLETLQELQLDSRTLVFFSSDNGPWYGGSTGGLRGMKGQWWEGGLRVPLIAWQPGRIPAGHVSHEPAIIMDLFTTSLKAAGVALPEDRTLDGRDIMPLLTGDAKSPHDALFSYQGTVRTVRVDNWKLHGEQTPPPDRRMPDWVDPRAPNGTTILGPKEQPGPAEFPGVRTGDRSTKAALFDLQNDPAEQDNVAGRHPKIVERLDKLIQEMKQVEAETRERLGL